MTPRCIYIGKSMQTILVIDDDEDLRDTISVLLEREGFRRVFVLRGSTKTFAGKPVGPWEVTRSCQVSCGGGLTTDSGAPAGRSLR